ncbi:MAG: YeeE/YedE family protein [Chloroflexi bacterium]|nr:YeeE/YedE family protein [Chloroflexota bacterium]
MAPFPLPVQDILGQGGQYILYLLIGIAFGAVLEVSGFGNSKLLAAQFYFKDLTVLKVMFTAIVVAMVLIFLTTALGILDFNLVWVNPTYLMPGIVGGLIMGVGFIVGGFCPGTSLVAAATFKLDGLFFALGAFFGIFLFGETVGFFESFWHSTYLGRFTLDELFGVDMGVVVFGVVLMALFMFWGGEQLERIIGKKDLKAAPKWRYGAAGGLALLGAVVMFIGMPTTEDKWAKIATEKETQLSERAVQIHPAELLGLIYNDRLNVRLLDVRSESDYNAFHILDAERLPPDTILQKVADYQTAPANTVFVVMSNDEAAATEAWKTLTAESVPNVYILEGGVNNWLATFAAEEYNPSTALPDAGDDHLRYAFPVALGARNAAAKPNPETFAALEYTSKVQLKSKRGATGGGCG